MIKPNLIAKRFKSQTHPVVIIELAKLAREHGGQVAVADSPAWNSLENNARSSGLLQQAAENGIPLFELKDSRRLDTPAARRYKHLRVAKQLCQADVIINVPKLKTHQQLKLTAGIKNMFGGVPGKRKALWHLRAGGDRLDLRAHAGRDVPGPETRPDDHRRHRRHGGQRPDQRVRPPPGRPDRLARRICRRVGRVRTGRLQSGRPGHRAGARELGVGPRELSEVELLGADLARLKVTDFKFPALMPVGFSLPRVIKSTFKQLWLLQREKVHGRR